GVGERKISFRPSYIRPADQDQELNADTFPHSAEAKHYPAMTILTPDSIKAAARCGGGLASVTSTFILFRGTICAKTERPSFVASAKTITRRAASTIAVIIAA